MLNIIAYFAVFSLYLMLYIPSNFTNVKVVCQKTVVTNHAVRSLVNKTSPESFNFMRKEHSGFSVHACHIN